MSSSSSATLSSTFSTTDASPSATPVISDLDDPVPVHHVNAVVAFMIGFAIIMLASILNAGGLNLTKLDHVRTSSIPKASRRKDWLRPLWLLGMILYILSQLIGSTLALQYLRAEYVAPLGSSSLIFNFLFASVLIGTPVTSTDIYGTIIVIAGVVGIVLFGSINSGLETEMDIVRLTHLWRRGNWILYFVFWSVALVLLYIFVSQLELILNSRSDISAEPFAGQGGNRADSAALPGVGWRKKIFSTYQSTLHWIRDKLDSWTAAKDDKTLAWTLGIGWACCGGGLAGGCLVFAKACVNLISGSLSHTNTGNQFFHFAAIATFLFLAITAVFQIICLNRGLKAYESTLVVPVFYGVYTASGFLNSLIFNNEVDQYKSWILFLVFLSISVLISGVVLLTHKKPESKKLAAPLAGAVPRNRKQRRAKDETLGRSDGDVGDDLADSERTALSSHHARGDGEIGNDGGDDEVMWDVGEASDDEDGTAVEGDDAGKKDADAAHGAFQGRRSAEGDRSRSPRIGLAGSGQAHGEEGRGLMQHFDDDTHDVW